MKNKIIFVTNTLFVYVSEANDFIHYFQKNVTALNDTSTLLLFR